MSDIQQTAKMLIPLKQSLVEKSFKNSEVSLTQLARIVGWFLHCHVVSIDKK